MSKLLAGRYELIEKIGEGGMAVVYKAKDRLLNRYIAIKILRPEFTKDRQFVENFRKESQAAAGLQHPNIVSVYDVGTEGNIHYIVMELIDGRPLSEIIREEAPFDYKRVMNITKQVAAALNVAHRNNIVHRDVKPHNIMMTKDGTAKLTDFGIAKAVSSSTLVSDTNKIIGSVHYFSPEQARGAYVDERSDIYSLGIVMYEMLTGKVPFDGENPVQIALMHINNDITPPSSFVSGIPPKLEKMVMKCSAKLQTDRYKNIDELLTELDNIDFVTKMVGTSMYHGEINSRSAEEEFAEITPKEKKSKERKSKTKEKPEKKKEKTAKKPKSKGNKKGLVAMIALVVVIAIALVVAVSGFFSRGIEVPDLTNMTVEEATAALDELKLEIEVGDTVPSDEVEEGRIASQMPLGGEKIDKDEKVTVMISSGKPTGEVPSLIGKMFDEDTISAFLTANNYALGSVTRVESDYEEGRIIKQTPSAYSVEKMGTSVDILVSKGTSKVEIPSLVGSTVDEAKKALTKAGLTVGKITYEESSVYKEDIVINHDYSAGEKVEKKTKVNLVVSKGTPPITPPDNTDDVDDNQADNPSGEQGNKPDNGNSSAEGSNNGNSTSSEGNKPNTDNGSSANSNGNSGAGSDTDKED